MLIPYSVIAQEVGVTLSSCLPISSIKYLTPVGGFGIHIDNESKINNLIGIKYGLGLQTARYKNDSTYLENSYIETPLSIVFNLSKSGDILPFIEARGSYLILLGGSRIHDGNISSRRDVIPTVGIATGLKFKASEHFYVTGKISYIQQLQSSMFANDQKIFSNTINVSIGLLYR